MPREGFLFNLNVPWAVVQLSSIVAAVYLSRPALDGCHYQVPRRGTVSLAVSETHG